MSRQQNLDTVGRPLRNLRLSVTDRCNLRCGYCMPEESYTWLSRDRLLRFEEVSRLVDVFVGLGVEKVRLTGGEPLLRRGLDELVGMLAAKEGVRDLALTTNAMTLSDQVESLRDAGLSRLTISLDTLDRERFRELTRRDGLVSTHRGIDAAIAAGFTGTKVNTVVMRGINDDELVPMLDFGREKGLEIRFIEYMDVGGATRWSMDHVVSKREILSRLESHFGVIAECPSESSAPANRFALPDGTEFGIIASTTEPFCSTCDRSRLTADGHWYRCLYAHEGTNLRKPLVKGASDEELADLILGRWTERADRGAEERFGAGRTPLTQADLERDPHLEMHTRGG